MKKVMLLVVGAVFLLATPSCRKGENDPVLSLKTRKKRVVGEYIVSKLESNEVHSNDNSQTITTKKVYDGEKMTETIINGNSTQNNLITVNTADWSFTKDGEWKMAWSQTKTTVDDNQFSTTTTTENITVSQSGTWAFVGKTKDQSKNKERIQLSILKKDITKNTKTDYLDKSTNTTTNTTIDEINNNTYLYLEHVVVYNIDMLKNKEMVFKLDQNQSTYSFYNDGSYSYGENYATQYTETMTLTEK